MNVRRILMIPTLAVSLAFGTSLAFGAGGTTGNKCPDGQQMVFSEIEQTADGYLGTMRKQLAESFKALEASIASGDQGQIQTQNESITNIKAFVKLAEQDNIQLKEASAKKNKEDAAHQLVKICLAKSKVNELFNQVQSAGGVVDVVMTEVERQMNHTPSLPVAPALAQTFLDEFGEDASLPPEEFVSGYK